MRAMIIVAALVAAGCGARQAPEVGDPLAGKSGDELFAMALVHEQSGDLVRAEQYLGAAVRRGFPEHRAIEPLLRICVGSSRYGAALAHLEDYLQRHPAAWQLRFVAASLYAAVGRDRDAQRELERIVAEEPGANDPKFALARSYRASGDPAGARELFRAYLEDAPDGRYASRARTALVELRRERRERQRAQRRAPRRGGSR